MERFKRTITKKDSGHVSSLLIGLFTFLLILILALFTYRRYMIQVNFDYIDDNLVTSALAAAIVNQPEYGRSNQVIIHDSDKYTDSDVSGGDGYTDKEKAILLSELNYGSDVIVTDSALENKQVIDKEYRKNYSDDTVIARSLNDLSRCLTYNMSSGNNDNSYGLGDSPVTRPDDLNIEKILSFDESTFRGTMLSDFIVEKAKVTRLDIYSLYRATLAKRHLYRSEFFDDPEGYPVVVDDYTARAKWKSEFPVEGTPAWMEVHWTPETGTVTTRPPETKIKLDSYENFDKVYKPVRYVGLAGGKVITSDTVFTGCVENESYGSQLAEYNRQLMKYEAARNAVDNNWLLCYLDSFITYQGPYESDMFDGVLVNPDDYRCYYSEQYNFQPVGSVNRPLRVENGVKAPVLGYHLYSYRAPRDLRAKGDLRNKTGEYFSIPINSRNDLINNKEAVKIQDGIMAGTVIENSSIYVEFTFNIRIFPRTIFDAVVDWGIKNCTVARLVDIEANSKFTS